MISYKNKLLLVTFALLGMGATAQNLRFAKGIGGIAEETGTGIAVDASGNVYTIGYFQGKVDFDPGPDTYNLIATGGPSDVFISKLDASGNFVWAKSITGPGDDAGWSIAVDNSGNLYTACLFAATIHFDTIAGSDSIVSAGMNDILISKLDTAGHAIWRKRIGDTGNDDIAALAIDGSGNVYVTGVFTGIVDFDPGAGVHNLGSGPVGSAMYVLKLEASGNFGWVQAIGDDDDSPSAIAVDLTRNAYIGGFFGGTTDFDPGAGVSNLVSAGNGDIFVMKLDATGNFGWAKGMGGANDDFARSVAVDPAGNVYLTGSFEGTVDFDPGTGTSNLASVADGDIFVMKLDATANFTWAKSMGGPGFDNSVSLLVDALGNVLLTGSFSGTVDFDPGTGVCNLVSNGDGDLFISKLSASGNFAGAIRIGGTGEDFGQASTLDGSGNICITGAFAGTVDFDPGAGTTNLVCAGVEDVFIMKLSTNALTGVQQWDEAAGALLSVYPVPAKDLVTLQADPALAGLTYTVTDVAGVNVLNGTMHEGATQVNMSSLDAGIYFLQVGAHGSQTCKKIIKQ